MIAPGYYEDAKRYKEKKDREARREAEEDARWKAEDAKKAQEAKQKADEANGAYDWKEGQKVAYVTVKNTGSSTIRLDNFKNWYGTPVGGSFPPFIPSHGEVRFPHVQDNSHGSIAAVQYVGKNKAGNPRGMILAWDAPTDYRPPKLSNRVYTINGTKPELDKMKWDTVLVDLEKASASTSYASIVHQPDSSKIVANINFDGF